MQHLYKQTTDTRLLTARWLSASYPDDSQTGEAARRQESDELNLDGRNQNKIQIRSNDRFGLKPEYEYCDIPQLDKASDMLNNISSFVNSY